MTAITTPLVTDSGVRDIFIAEGQYALIATTAGVDVIDLFTQEVISSGTLAFEPLCIVADSDTTFGKMFVGTSGGGIYSVRYLFARDRGSDFTGSLVQQFTTATSPAITANQVNDLAAQGSRLFISTASGVDFITDESLRAFRPLESGSSNCQITSNGEAYWAVVNSGIEVNYDLFPSSGTGIITVDFEYNATDSDPILPTHFIEDLAIKENTPNLIGVATTSGALVVEESQFSEPASRRQVLVSGTGANSIDFSPDAAFETGLIYVTTVSQLTIIGLVDVTVSGTHKHTDITGNPGEGTRGQPLVTGTVSIVRTTNVP